MNGRVEKIMLEVIISTLSRNWIGNVESVIKAVEEYGLSKKELKSVANFVADGLGKGRFRNTTNWFILGLVTDPKLFTTHLKRRGILRSSHYNYSTCVLVASLEAILSCKELSNLPSGVIRYFESVLSLAKLAPSVGSINLGIIKKMRGEKKTFLKSITATIDYLFMTDHLPDRARSTSDWQHFSIEELTIGASYLHSLFDEHIGITAPSTQYLNVNRILDNSYHYLMTQAILVRKYHEWEIMVDWEIESVSNTNGEWVISPISERQKKAIVFGYHVSSMAMLKGALLWQEGASFADYAEAIYEKILKPLELVKIVDEPIRRAVLQFPVIPELNEMLQQEDMFLEEIRFIAYAKLTYLKEYQGFMEYELYEGVSIRSLILVSRIVNIFRFVMKRFYEENLSDDLGTIIQSLVPVFSEKQFYQFLEMVLDSKTVHKVIEMLSSENRKGIFDLQYNPIIAADGFYMVPMNVMGSSSIIRNSFQLMRSRIIDKVAINPAELFLVRSFEKLGFPAAQGIGYNFARAKGEIDVMAIMDNILFVFECKSSLLPASSFELRTTLDHIHKAEKQLNRFMELSKDPEYISYLLEKSGLQCQDIEYIVTCVICSNRMLSGGLAGSHPIRGLFEICGYLFNGGIEICGKRIPFAGSESVTGSDLRNYIQEDPVHNIMFNAMKTVEVEYSFGRANIQTSNFFLDPEKLFAILKDKGLWHDEEEM